MSRPFNIMESFWSRVEKLGNESGCWLWMGGCTDLGYGLFHPGKGMNYGAHRFSAELAGMDVKDKNVCHKCDTPSCVNPNHLFVSTQLGNMRDKVSKNRQANCFRRGCHVVEIAVIQNSIGNPVKVRQYLTTCCVSIYNDAVGSPKGCDSAD